MPKFPQGSILAFRVVLPPVSLAALGRLHEHLSPNAKSGTEALRKGVEQMDLIDMNALLYLLLSRYLGLLLSLLIILCKNFT